ncbi:hypothetical protein Prudu_170S000300 [Prunus dulcis]|uniref:Integrase catalytic domain-containing protein n=1 Tax=Prunus dulcis TaxID=3755 RepID=A0A5H2XKE0_PRUDU|nr:hypothetical protein Prudu_170S000300 [Prunus dulcis]
MGKISYFLNKLRKRKHNVDKTAFLTKNVSAILQTNTLPKYKDPVLYTEPVVHSNSQIPIILGRPFLATSNAHINYRNGLMQLSFGNMTLELNIFNICKKPANNEDVDKEVQEHNGWIPKYEELPTPLPAGLKYAFLGEDETYHVVISSKLELLHEGIIYPISDSKWVSPTYVVPKKSGVTVVENDNGEMVPTRVTAGWRMCIDYRYYQIEVSLEDQEKTTFACPFGTFAFRKMPFGLCNAPATFQRCMISIFSDMVLSHLIGPRKRKRNLWLRFGTPRAIISDGGSHFCNRPFEALMKSGMMHMRTHKFTKNVLNLPGMTGAVCSVRRLTCNFDTMTRHFGSGSLIAFAARSSSKIVSTSSSSNQFVFQHYSPLAPVHRMIEAPLLRQTLQFLAEDCYSTSALQTAR